MARGTHDEAERLTLADILHEAWTGMPREPSVELGIELKDGVEDLLARLDFAEKELASTKGSSAEIHAATKG